MTLSGGLWGEVGLAEERRRAFAARRAHSVGGGAATDAEGEAIQARRRTSRKPLQIRSGRTRVRKATLGVRLAPVRPVCYTTPLNQIWTPRWSPARTLTSDPTKSPAASSLWRFWR